MTKRWMLMLLAVLALGAAACTSDSNLDDGGSADVVLQILTIEAPPVTAESGLVAGCQGTIEEWAVTMAVVPKNALAGGDSAPFNDVTMQSVTIEYDWIDGSGNSTPARTIGLGGVTVPSEGTATVLFFPIDFDDWRDLNNTGTTADLTLTFTSRTTEGATLRKTVTEQLFVELCL